MSRRPLSPPTGRRRGIPTLFLGVCLILAFFSLRRVFRVAADQLAAPFDLVYESPNLTTIEDIRAGRNIYSPDIYADIPFHLTIYPPLYHYLVAALPPHPRGPFFAGRLVSMVFMVLAASSLFATAGKGDRVRFGLLGVSAFFLIGPVVSNTPFLKNDSLGLCLSVLAVLATEKLGDRKGGAIGAAGLCLLALAAKQTFVAAAATCFVHRLARDRKSAFLFGAAFVGLAATAGTFAQARWGSGFWFCVLEAPRGSPTWEQFADLWGSMLRKPVFALLLALTGAVALSSWRSRKGAIFRDSPYPAYALSSGLVLAATLGKAGSSTNYFFEFILACLLWTVHSSRAWPIDSSRGMMPFAALAALTLCEGFELKRADRSSYSFLLPDSTERYLLYRQTVSREIASLGVEEPRVLNLYGAKIVHDFPKPACVNDPLLYSILWEEGTLGADSIRRAIEKRSFDLVILPPGVGPSSGPYRPLSAFADVFFREYRLRARGVRFNYWTPIP